MNKFRKAFGDGTEDKNGVFHPIAPVTMAVSVEPSKLLVVDTDTAAERQAFCAWMAQKAGRPELAFTTPTVLSPGVFKDGEWVHKDGGHFYFAVGDVELPLARGKMSITHDGASFDVFWRDRYILIPPSERKEGRYERLGPVLNLSDNMWMVAEISQYIEDHKPKERNDDDKLPPEVREGLIEWYGHTPWSTILEPHGWERTGNDSVCGCEQWGRPGRSSDKSATAHVPGCLRQEYTDSPDPPIHFWTRFPGREIQDKLTEVRGETLSKLQLLAAVEYDGSDHAAMGSITELPARRIVGVEIVPGRPFAMSIGAVRYEATDTESDLLDMPNMVMPAHPYVAQPTPPNTAPISTPHAATPAATNPFNTGGVHHVSGLPFGMSSSSSENLVGTAPSNIITAEQNFQNPAMNPATGIATDTDTGTNTDSATVTSTPRYEDRYENVDYSSPWDSDTEQKSTEQIVADTVAQMTPIITATILDTLRSQGIIS